MRRKIRETLFLSKMSSQIINCTSFCKVAAIFFFRRILILKKILNKRLMSVKMNKAKKIEKKKKKDFNMYHIQF